MVTPHAYIPPAPPIAVPASHRLIELFWTLGPAFTRWAESHMHHKGLTPQRVRLLWLLCEHGPLMMSNLRNLLGFTATNVTALVDALEKDGMVARKSHPTDRRATMIEITEKAELQLRENCAEFKDKVADIFSSFTTAQREDFLTHLLHMREAMVDRSVLNANEGACRLAKEDA